jgi:arylsulfatase A
MISNTLISNTLISNTLIGNTMIGNTMIGNTMIGNTMIGNTMIGNTMIGNTMIGNLLSIFLLALASSSAVADGPPQHDETNVVLILIDDMGWKDLGCYGSQYYQTPNVDRLAAEGMRFTDGYAACNVCSPTRAAIMTGRYPARLLLTQWLPSGRWSRTKHKMKEGRYISNLALEDFTIAEAMREAGYRTAFMGKWHLGTETYYFPEHQGFDVNVGGRDYGAPGSYFYPFKGSWKIPTTGQTLHKETPLAGKKGDYLVDRLAEEAEKFIRANADKPFFLMLSHYAVHTPLQGKPNKVARYAKIPKQKQQGQPAYAAMVESVDDSVGRVMCTLRDLKLDDQTLVIFTSDNGGHARATNNSPLRANKGSNYEGGIRVPVIVKWPGKSQPGSVCRDPVISTDFYPTILQATGHPLKPHQHMDGVSLVPALRGEKLNRDAIYWHYPHYNQHPQSFPSGVVRSGNWKLIESFETDEVQLFNLADDIGETNNLVQREPAKTAELLAKLKAWRADTGADPMKPNPEYNDPGNRGPKNPGRGNRGQGK